MNKAQPLQGPSSATASSASIAEILWIFDWGEFQGPAGLAEHIRPLINAGAAGGWICVEYLGDDDDFESDLDHLAVAIGAADNLIIAKDIGALTASAGAMAMKGTKIVLVEWRRGLLPTALVDALTSRPSSATDRGTRPPP
jgi:hypothetical protein